MYLDAYKARLLLETESEEDSIINKNVENRQTASGVKVLKKKKVGVGFGNFNIFSTLYPLKTVLN